MQVRGVRIEAAEVEAAYEEHDGIARAAAVPFVVDDKSVDGGVDGGADGSFDSAAVECHGGVTRLIVCCEPAKGWFGKPLNEHDSACEDSVLACTEDSLGAIATSVLAGESVAAAAALTSWGNEHLPMGMRPDAVVLLARIPTLASGKVDRQGLRRLVPRMLLTLSMERERQRPESLPTEGYRAGAEPEVRGDDPSRLLCASLGALSPRHRFLGRAFLWHPVSND